MYDTATTYLETISEDDTVLIVHHWDMDGSAAAAITSRILQEVRGQPADRVMLPEGRRHRIGPGVERVIKEEGVTHLIVLDMHLPMERAEELKELGVEIMNVDHHTFNEVPDIVFVNPRVEDRDAYVPAAKLCNDLAQRFGLDTDWIAGMGIIQDFAVEGHEELFKRLREEHPHYFPDELTQERLAKGCRYGKYASVLNIKPYKDSERCAELAHDALTKLKCMKYLEASKEYAALHDYYREMYREIERVVENYDEEKREWPEKGIVFFQFDSDYYINSSIATTISLDREDWVHLIANVHHGTANISARCQSGAVNLGELLQEAFPEGVEGDAGGHDRAAGASVPAKHLDNFVEQVAELVPPLED